MSLTSTADTTFTLTTVILSQVKALDLCFGWDYYFKSSLAHSLIYGLSTKSQVDQEENMVSFHLHRNMISNQAFATGPLAHQITASSEFILLSCEKNSRRFFSTASVWKDYLHFFSLLKSQAHFQLFLYSVSGINSFLEGCITLCWVMCCAEIIIFSLYPVFAREETYLLKLILLREVGWD